MSKELYYITGIINGRIYRGKFFGISPEDAKANAHRIAADYLQGHRCNDNDMMEVIFEPKSPYYE
jgi:hypothetical protein